MDAGDRFRLGQEYDRADLLDSVGSGQGQTGIIWGSDDPTVLICTTGGRHGTKSGYEDGRHKNGTWTYSGQGRTGDQDPSAYPNRLLIEGERTVLLFSTREPTSSEVASRGHGKKYYRYEGAFGVAAWDVYVPESGKRSGDKLLRFELVPTKGLSVESTLTNELAKGLAEHSLSELRARLDDLGGGKPPKGKFQLAKYYERSQLVTDYVTLRAHGSCELCGTPAPFNRPNGQPFLEVHHILRLADDGPDDPENCAALCPNCHRLAHYGPTPALTRAKLIEIVHAIELA